ncbi:MAG: DUF4147 domain-containing protein [Gammaproteobacteria bacterium]|nr:DUF4147 domain-containing protein [Gammaproteobacteria bacterium]
MDLPDIFTVLESAHPIPDQTSLDAGAALLTFIGQAPKDTAFLFLISDVPGDQIEAIGSGLLLPGSIFQTEDMVLLDWIRHVQSIARTPVNPRHSMNVLPPSTLLALTNRLACASPNRPVHNR